MRMVETYFKLGHDNFLSHQFNLVYINHNTTCRWLRENCLPFLHPFRASISCPGFSRTAFQPLLFIYPIITLFQGSQQWGGAGFPIRLRLKCDGTRAETRLRLSAKETSLFKSAGASVQSTTGSRGVRICGSNAGYTMFRGSVKCTGYPLHSPSFPFTSPPVRHRVPSHFNWTLPKAVIFFRQNIITRQAMYV
jgi:hypothetical protein